MKIMDYRPFCLLALLPVAHLGTFLLEADESTPAKPIAAPLNSPWDAEAWEPGSGDAFWNAAPAFEPTLSDRQSEK